MVMSDVVVMTMLPKVFIHNSVSLDGSLTGFEPNMELHYQIAGDYKPDVHLIGSNTAKVGVELFGNGVPPEEKTDFEKPKRNKSLPYWVIPDTKGILKGLLHVSRRFEFCKDVIVLLSQATPRDYIGYLEERNYDYFVVGKEQVDLKKSLELLSAEFKAKKVLTDTGRILGNLLLEQSLVDEISLLLHPIIVGKTSYNIFSNLDKNLGLILRKQEFFDGGYVWLVYKVIN
jgi:2,5-diamino-6-(ribosylamino)-4(3H)-pyrimidinone 5'-phosphate reductase